MNIKKVLKEIMFLVIGLLYLMLIFGGIIAGVTIIFLIMLFIGKLASSYLIVGGILFIIKIILGIFVVSIFLIGAYLEGKEIYHKLKKYRGCRNE